jgi:hypothetical protein
LTKGKQFDFDAGVNRNICGLVGHDHRDDREANNDRGHD